MDIVQASIPFFFLLIGLELGVARLRGRRLYRLNDSISDLSCGILSQLAGIALAFGTIGIYAWIQSRWSLHGALGLPGWIARSPFPALSGGGAAWLDAAALASWGTVFLLDDLAYYWMHRCSHVVALLWAGHVVHHSSEEYNLTVALRQSSLHGLLTWIFYMPLALLGVPIGMWLACHGLNLVYQFWIHTRAVGRLGPLEWVLNTPSHHRVHHGVNPEYQDRNYAGVFIIWDRLFGTFEPERAEPVYGITRPLASWNPVWANLHVFRDIQRNLGAATGWREKLRALLGHPGWRPAALGPPVVPPPVSADRFVRYDPPIPPALQWYALVQFVALLVASFALLVKSGEMATGPLLAGGFYLAVGLANLGGVLEARNWAAVSEVARLLVLGAVAAALLATGGAPLPVAALALVLAAGSLAWVLRLRPLFTSNDPRAVVVM